MTGRAAARRAARDRDERLAAAGDGTPAVVLKLDPNVMHHGGLGVIRSLGRMGVPVYGVHESRLAPAAGSRYLRGRCVWRPGADDAERIRDGLLALAGRIGRPAVLLPTDDAGAIFLAEHGADLRPWFIFPDQPAGLAREVAGKFSLHQLCARLGVPAAAAVVPGSDGEARDFGAIAGYPLIAKLTEPWQDGTSAGAAPGAAAGHVSLPSTSVIADQAGLDDAYRAATAAGAGLMLQEFIPGGPGADWFFHGYCDAACACRPAFTGVKERSYPAHAGLTSLGRAEPNPELRDQVTDLLGELGYRGILDMDLRRDSRDGQYKLLDFNPRLGAQFRLFQTTAGVDVARAAYLDLTGATVPAGEPEPGRRYLVESYDPLGALGYWRRGELSARGWLASMRSVDEVAWFAADDLRPFGLMCLRMGWRLASRPAGRLAGLLPGGPAPRNPGRQPRFLPGRAARRAGLGMTSHSDAASAASERPVPAPEITRRPAPLSSKEGARA
ncbi:MAG TPA: ATP-grasp domain-containing protein [Streptosporangiaceae bacterium]|jgi:predicted ATP-grasp superfamily ATP-dependent carboligase